MRASLALAVVLALAPRHSPAQVPIRFESYRYVADLSVFLDMTSAFPDEVWHVSGVCRGVRRARKVHVSTLYFATDLAVRLTPTATDADRIVCIVNPEDAPEAFMEAVRGR